MDCNRSWWKEAVFYQIYPRSFQDSNDDGVGDLPGIRARLDYLVNLGIDAIWISPIFPSPMADFGYDISDYLGIDPIFGSMQDFDQLLEAAHQRGIRVVLDYVANHTSDEHPWFIQSCQSRNNPKRDWYIWRDPAPGGGPPNNWESMFGGSAWEWDETTQQYYLHLFLEKQPDLNWRNPQVVQAMQDVLRFWLDKGVDGFRMDVVTFLIKHPYFPDNPLRVDQDGQTYQEHRYDINQPEVHQVLKDFRSLFDHYPGERVTIGETWFEDPKELATWYGGQLDELHLPFNFITLQTPWQAAKMKQAIEGYYAALPPGATPNFVFGNHDRSRLASRYGYENHRAVGMLLLTLRGTPTLYYGDEIGMRDMPIPPERIQDPVALRKPDQDEGRDPERTPMRWDASPNAGFCPASVEPWLPMGEDLAEVNVAAQSQDPASTLNYYRALLALRRELRLLRQGEFEFLEVSNPDLLAYARKYGQGADQPLEAALVVINFGDEAAAWDASETGSQGELLLSTHPFEKQGVDLKTIRLRPHEGVIIRLQ